MAKIKKHVALYNRVWEALHEDDLFVCVHNLTHDEMVSKIRRALSEVLRFRAHENDLLDKMAEAVMTALLTDEENDRYDGKRFCHHPALLIDDEIAHGMT